MIELKKAIVKDIIKRKEQITILNLDINHKIKKAILYNNLTGKVKVGDEVIVNTTACTLGLGTGGHHFVLANLSNNYKEMKIENEHGMKLKYTPLQIRPKLSEEKYSGFYDKALNLADKTVIIAELHSMLPCICAALKYKSQCKIAYVMTDHAALPVWFSNNIRELKEKELIDTVISNGNAFGGDHDCVNIYTSLLAASEIEKCDIIIITMGPGILGTGTKYGFSGLELGLYMNLCINLKNNPIYIPRISFADNRERHKGISHHSITILNEIITSKLRLVLPLLSLKKNIYIFNQLKINKITSKHRIVFKDGKPIINALNHYNLSPKTMGRGIQEDPDFFFGVGACVL